jgi:hypothetical protein
MSSSAETSSWGTLRAHLQSRGIDTLPDFSESVRQGLREERQALHASLILEADAADLPAWADLLRGQASEAALCGFSGYGVQSEFFVLHWRHGPLILLSRTHFGALGDAARDSRRASGLIALANALMLRADQLHAASLWPPDRLMLVVDDEFDDSGWCWIESVYTLDSYTLDTSLGLAGAFAALKALSGSDESEALS